MGKGRPADEARMLAQINGERTYRGTPHGCGTNERYTIGGACVFCALRVQREQREARIESQRQASEATALLDIATGDFFNAPSGDPWD